ncbi:hypothetical protein E2C01_006219 [Portunus trituberculatus]|uniref:Uncharacterized protein n=1 Tax=Portunus trituberculatus TaxID=210409 RepID=A0A5B7CUM7_PORTR|nr:hypothetical protein [Portunus trituberculatus]
MAGIKQRLLAQPSSPHIAGFVNVWRNAAGFASAATTRTHHTSLRLKCGLAWLGYTDPMSSGGLCDWLAGWLAD